MLSLLCSGCFTYVPADPGSVAPGEDLRVHLTRQEALPGLANVTGELGQSVDGRLVRGDPDQLVLRVPVGTQPGAILTRTLGQDITIPATRVVQLERRQLSRARTGLALAGGAAGLIVALLSFGEGVPNPELPPRQEPDDRGIGWAIPVWRH
jgi:hypothetical protein